MHQTPDDLDIFVHRQLTRRQLVGGVVATLASAGLATKARSADGPADPTVRSPKLDSSSAAMKAKPTEMGGYDPGVLPPGIRSRFVNDVNGLRMHVLEAGFEVQDRPCVLLLHGFPDVCSIVLKIERGVQNAGLDSPLLEIGDKVAHPGIRERQTDRFAVPSPAGQRYEEHFHSPFRPFVPFATRN